MLYSNKRFDLSDYIVRTITRAAKRKQAKNRKSKKVVEGEDVIPVINTEKDERQRILDEKKAQRKKDLEERKKKALEAREAKRKAFEEKRKKLLEEREAKKNASSGPPQPPVEDNKEETEPK
jgi:hypothetical protein